MGEMLKFVAGIGSIAIFITPLTLIIGIVNAIKKPEGEDGPYIATAIISAYLIIIPIFYFTAVK